MKKSKILLILGALVYFAFAVIAGILFSIESKKV